MSLLLIKYFEIWIKYEIDFTDIKFVVIFDSEIIWRLY